MLTTHRSFLRVAGKAVLNVDDPCERWFSQRRIVSSLSRDLDRCGDV
jgi:hypothetical protein